MPGFTFLHLGLAYRAHTDVRLHLCVILTLSHEKRLAARQPVALGALPGAKLEEIW